MDILSTLNKIEKTYSNPTYIQGAEMMRENLSPVVERLPMKETPFRDRLPRKKGAGSAASWNVLSSMGVGNSPFAEGQTPTEDATTYVRRSAIYKELGKKKSITDKAIAAGQSFIDLDAELTEVAMREVIQDEEQLIITGDENISALQFDGLKVSITTNVTDNNANPLGFQPVLLDTEIARLVKTYGVRPTAIWVGYGMKKAINESLAGDVRVNLDTTNQVGIGVEVGFYQSMIGRLPFVASFAIATDTTTYPGQEVEDIYILCEKTRGHDVIYMEDLYGLGKGYLDRTGAAVKFMVTECTVLVNRAEEFHAKIENVLIS